MAPTRWRGIQRTLDSARPKEAAVILRNSQVPAPAKHTERPRCEQRALVTARNGARPGAVMRHVTWLHLSTRPQTALEEREPSKASRWCWKMLRKQWTERDADVCSSPIVRRGVADFSGVSNTDTESVESLITHGP
ncbi:hypothetical protein HPB50_015755 [Hyalomma asiaticum]|uniref:Uncharacterized protein n=1 Tax=Hyalomma asiaticum TaxID=266040 RepID=A0ACB7SYN9_HYAAI|nr:hypothetical protein HPB50_015755 [Hyalomma asiaticum]